MKEVWKDVPGWEGLTMVSDQGNIKHIERIGPTLAQGGFRVYPEIITKGYPVAEGYLRVTLSRNGKQIQKRVHRLVAQVFIPNPENKPEVNHKNGKRWDNRKVNLEWNTAKENTNHATKTGLRKPKAKIPILQCDLSGKVIKEWPSGTDAARELKISHGGICSTTKGNLENFCGFIWKYKSK